ncbi:MAG: hypothetical protein QOF74_3236 [Caballeronia mineralivorans]|jgi:hypothetical protein|nr:hypothetical protein [Caballeronia mineralivorans]
METDAGDVAARNETEAWASCVNSVDLSYRLWLLSLFAQSHYLSSSAYEQ